VRVEGRPVLDATRTFATVTAENVELAADAVWPMAGEPEQSAQRVLDRAAVAVAVDAMGLATAMLDATVAYAKDREQFDRPIGSFQAVKHQCADAFVQLRVGRELLDDAVAAVAADADDLPLLASRAKSFLTEAGVDVVGTAMQLHGGIGYTWESGIHRYLKRAVLDRALFGSPATHRRRIAAMVSF
jgi:alkylation response protein AidB-like acyl-CoA dehydrogenase